MRAAIFLDRDGVLNHVVPRDGQPGSPRSREEFVLYEDAADAVAKLQSAGYALFVITNQPDIARGHLAREALEAMTTMLRSRLPVDDVRVCPHDDADACVCRKPRPGMIEELARAWGVRLRASFVIGDSWKDIEAGRAAGCHTLLLRRPYNAGTTADFVAGSLSEAADLILTRRIVHG